MLQLCLCNKRDTNLIPTLKTRLYGFSDTYGLNKKRSHLSLKVHGLFGQWSSVLFVVTMCNSQYLPCSMLIKGDLYSGV